MVHHGMWTSTPELWPGPSGELKDEPILFLHLDYRLPPLKELVKYTPLPYSDQSNKYLRVGLLFRFSLESSPGDSSVRSRLKSLNPS